MMDIMLIPICLVALGVFLIAIEAFIPSAGVLAILAACALIGGVVAAFVQGGLYVGTAFMFATTVGVIAFVAWMIRIWPDTKLGKLILVEPSPPETLLPNRQAFQELVGRIGQTTSVMLPGGLIDIDGVTHEAVAMRAVEANTWVEVVKIRNGRILEVRPVDQEVALQRRQAAAREADPLSTPIDDVVPDPFNDPQT